MTDEERAQKIEQLAQEFAQNELVYNQRLVFNPESGTFWVPAPWLQQIKQLKERAEADGAAAPLEILPLPPSELAPMSDTLRELARELGFPEYNGTALPADMIGDEQYEAPDPGHRERCPKCGSWMEFQNILEWKYSRDKFPLRKKPTPDGPKVCGVCGYGLEVHEA
jgi:hypothetical protein